jgi:predicted GH43/DUF377 family glycosyl hydrolase
MWYTASDGDTSRILRADHTDPSGWTKRGIVIDAGFAGDSDAFGVESPCVVRTLGGYLMAYGGSDGELTRLHLASSDDGRTWVAQGTFMQREAEDLGGATDPCLIVTGERWWLFFTGRRVSDAGTGTAILAAVSQDGASWDRVGIIVQPESQEVAVSHPCVVDVSREFQMFYASDDGRRTSIDLATSSTGVEWDRRGVVLGPSGMEEEALSVHTPCVTKLVGGTLRMWYAGLPMGDEALRYQICSARFGSPAPIVS